MLFMGEILGGWVVYPQVSIFFSGSPTYFSGASSKDKLGSYKAILPDCFGYVFTTRSKDNAGFIQSDFVGLHAYDRFFCALPVPCLFTV